MIERNVDLTSRDVARSAPDNLTKLLRQVIMKTF